MNILEVTSFLLVPNGMLLGLPFSAFADALMFSCPRGINRQDGMKSTAQRTARSRSLRTYYAFEG